MPYDKWNQYYVYKKTDPKTGLPQGFRTPTKKLELYGDVFIELGRTGKPYALQKLPPVKQDYDPLPYYLEPAESHGRNRQEVSARSHQRPHSDVPPRHAQKHSISA